MSTYAPTPSNSTNRPQADIETTFNPENSDRLDPRGTTKNLREEGVVNTRLSSDAPEASTSNGLLEVDSNLAHELGVRVAARLDRPQHTAEVRRIALGPDHNDSLALAEITNTTCTSVELELRSTPSIGVSYHQSLPKEVREQISIYTPRIPAEDWEAIEHFVRQAVSDAEPKRLDTTKIWLHVVTGLARWCHEVACFELTYEVVFNVTTIERYLAQVPSDKPHTKATYRSRLMSIADQLVGPQLHSFRHKQFPRSTSADAYSPEEQLDLRTVRNNQATDYRRVNLGALIALGAGAGISTGEINRVRHAHVREHAGGLVVDVVGTNRPSRTVPVLAKWEDLLFQAFDPSRPNSWLFMPRREFEDSPNAATRLVATCNSVTTQPTIWRLRATWVVAHLNAGTPLPDLLESAGYESLAKFERFVPFLDRLPSDTRLTAMRLDGDHA